MHIFREMVSILRMLLFGFCANTKTEVFVLSKTRSYTLLISNDNLKRKLYLNLNIQTNKVHELIYIPKTFPDQRLKFAHLASLIPNKQAQNHLLNLVLKLVRNDPQMIK